MYKKRMAPTGAKGRSTSIDLIALNGPTNESHYWLGYLFANCSITSNHAVQTIARIQDASHLEKLRAFINNGNTIVKAGQKGKPANRVVYRVVSQAFSIFLQQRGISAERKDRVVPEKFAFDENFWRGYLDANSDIDEEDIPPTFHVQGTRAVVVAFGKYASRELGVKGDMLSSKDPCRYELIFSGDDAAKIVRNFWGNSSVLACEYMKASVDAFSLESALP